MNQNGSQRPTVILDKPEKYPQKQIRNSHGDTEEHTGNKENHDVDGMNDRKARLLLNNAIQNLLRNYDKFTKS